MDGQKSSVNIDAESLPSCYALPSGITQERDTMVALSPTALEMSPQILKDYPDLTFMK